MKDSWKERYTKAFGSHLKKNRLTKNMTQAKLAALSGVSLGHISRIERGVRDPTLNIIHDLAMGLKLHPSVLLEFKFEK